MGGGAAITAGLSISGCAEPGAVLDGAALDTLAAMSHHLYPHDRLDEAHYRTSIEGLEEKARLNSDIRSQLIAGVKALNSGASPSGFTDIDPADQFPIVESLEGSDFFETVRSHVVVSLYQDKRVWEKLGYEGPSFPFGGYLERGFDDIDWLPKTS